MKKASLKDAFVRNTGSLETQFSGDTAVQLPSYTAGEGSSATKNPATQRHSDTDIQTAVYPAPPKKKATFNLDARLHQRLKVVAAMHSREMVDIVEDALQKYLQTLDQKAG